MIRNFRIKNFYIGTRCVPLLFCAVFFVIADQVSKNVMFSSINELPASDSFIHLTKFRNYDFAFSLPIPPWLIFSIYAVIISVCGYYLYKNFHKFSQNKQFFWILIISGGLSNIIERICLGYVRDFIAIPLGGIINFADVYIVVGIVYLLWYESQTHKTDATKEHN